MGLNLKLTELILPMPPSVNSTYTSRANGGKRVAKSSAYWFWHRHARESVQDLTAPAPGGQPVYRGPVVVWIELPFRGDVDNRTKALLDFLGTKGQGLRVYADDSQVFGVTSVFNRTLPRDLCRVSITQAENFPALCAMKTEGWNAI